MPDLNCNTFPLCLPSCNTHLRAVLDCHLHMQLIDLKVGRVWSLGTCGKIFANCKQRGRIDNVKVWHLCIIRDKN